MLTSVRIRFAWRLGDARELSASPGGSFGRARKNGFFALSQPAVCWAGDDPRGPPPAPGGLEDNGWLEAHYTPKGDAARRRIVPLGLRYPFGLGPEPGVAAGHSLTPRRQLSGGIPSTRARASDY
jgi:hypothetical protein